MVVIVMGVAGAGKTTIGRMLAEALGFEYQDADDFPPPVNVEKMRRGQQLDDRDREPWLDALARAIDGWLQSDANVVLACSALKARYRARLMRDPRRMRLVYLKVAPDVARARVERRVGHFMPHDLVESQFAALEEPDDAIVIEAARPPEGIVDTIANALTPD